MILLFLGILIVWFCLSIKDIWNMYHEDMGACSGNIYTFIGVAGTVISLLYFVFSSNVFPLIVFIFIDALYLIAMVAFVPRYEPWQRINYPRYKVYDREKDYKRYEWLKKHFNKIFIVLIGLFIALTIIELFGG